MSASVAGTANGFWHAVHTMVCPAYCGTCSAGSARGAAVAEGQFDVAAHAGGEQYGALGRVGKAAAQDGAGPAWQPVEHVPMDGR